MLAIKFDASKRSASPMGTVKCNWLQWFSDLGSCLQGRLQCA